MHVFDRPEERVSTREKFITLMSELESLRMKEDMSATFFSDSARLWHRLLVARSRTAKYKKHLGATPGCGRIVPSARLNNQNSQN
jgi:hypothetical protein